MAHDLVIRGGLVANATDAFVADLGIRHGRIASIGERLEDGASEIDARGLQVLPGGVDVHKCTLFVLYGNMADVFPVHQIRNQVNRLVLMHGKQVGRHELLNAQVAGFGKRLLRGPGQWPAVDGSAFVPQSDGVGDKRR